MKTTPLDLWLRPGRHGRAIVDTFELASRHGVGSPFHPVNRSVHGALTRVLSSGVWLLFSFDLSGARDNPAYHTSSLQAWEPLSPSWESGAHLSLINRRDHTLPYLRIKVNRVNFAKLLLHDQSHPPTVLPPLLIPRILSGALRTHDTNLQLWARL